MQRRSAGDDTGATSVEYALMASLIFLVIVAGVTAVGIALADIFESFPDLT